MINDIEYINIDNKGLHICRSNKFSVLGVDSIVVCAGQESNKELFHSLVESGYNLILLVVRMKQMN